MIEVGITDVFERHYMQKFRAFAGQFGEFVTYERDRGARDLGLHLTHKLASGKERLSSALCWFQMKGVMASSLSAKDFETAKEVKLSLDVNHLRYWYPSANADAHGRLRRERRHLPDYQHSRLRR